MSFQFDPNAVSEVNQESIEESGLRFPGIIFFSGDMGKKPKKNQPDPGMVWRGGFFISKESLSGDDLTASGWVEDSFISQGSGEEVEGWSKHEITIMHIARRRRWACADKQYFAWKDSKAAQAAGSMRGAQQSIVLVQGLEHLGPFCLSLSGHAQMAFNGEGDYLQTGALSNHRRTVIQKANEVTKEASPKGVAAKKWDHYAFWLTVGAASDANGDPKFTEVGKVKKSQVVLPVPVGLPSTAAEVKLEDYYVGPAMLSEAVSILDMLQDEGWKEAWNNFDAVATNGAASSSKVAVVAANYAEEAGV